jgi:hypothetical protein
MTEPHTTRRPATTANATKPKAVKTPAKPEAGVAKKSAPRRGRKRGRCQLAYCVEEVCIHCTCDGSCGRGHEPKLCGNRRYEKRANCNQCKVAYYCTKRKNAELMVTAAPTAPPPLNNNHSLSLSHPPQPMHPSLLEQDMLKKNRTKAPPAHSTANKKVKREHAVSQPHTHHQIMAYPPPPVHHESYMTYSMAPSMHHHTPFMQHQHQAAPVDWEDAWRASSFSVDSCLADGGSSPMSSASSEADLTSLVPDFGDSTGGESRMYECNDLKDPDLCDVGDKDGLFNCLLDDMENGNWDSFVENTPLFADVF